MTFDTQKKQFDFILEPPKISLTLSGIDSMDCKIDTLTDIDILPSKAQIVGHFSGIINNIAFADTEQEVSTKATVDGELSRLDNFAIKDKYSAQNESLIVFLNKNPAGIVFANKNLLPNQLFFSYKITQKSWYQVLTDLSKNLGFEFWYDYELQQCWLGEPDEIVVLDDERFEFVKDFERPSVVSYNFKSLYNRVIAKGGQLNSVELADANNINSNNPVVDSIDEFGQTYSYIQDAVSITKYGVRELFIASPTINQSAGSTSSLPKTQLANLLYQQALRLLLKHREPQITITGVEAIGDKNLVKIGNKLRISTLFADHNKIIAGDFFVTKIDYTIDRDTDQYKYGLTLMNYLDKQSLSDNILSRLQKVDEIPPLNQQQLFNLTSLGTIGLGGIGYALTATSYNLNDTFKLGITQYSFDLIITQTTLVSGTGFGLTAILIDSISIPVSSIGVSNLVPTNSLSFDITTANLSQSQKVALYNSGVHNIELVGQGNASVSIAIAIKVVGYN